jgi:cell wall-associated NlpC family hydrolase
MYIGRGKIVNASDYGVGVIISPMKGTAWTNAHFTGVGRVA